MYISTTKHDFSLNSLENESQLIVLVSAQLVSFRLINVHVMIECVHINVGLSIMICYLVLVADALDLLGK